MDRDDIFEKLARELIRAAPSLDRIAEIYDQLKAELDSGAPDNELYRQQIEHIGQTVASWRLCKSLDLTKLRPTLDN